MKRYVWMIAAFALIGLVVYSCRARTKNTDVIDGGVRHREDTNAPKVIQSTKITSFSCKASAVGMMEEDTPLAGNIFKLQATEKEASYHRMVRGGSEETFSFVPDKAFLDGLQEIVAKYDFAQQNGIYYSVSGIPEHFGSKIDICYESGERISASNNQHCFLSIEALEALNDLFLRYRQ